MNNLNKGKFIVFEGINGSGKTTIINILINYLEDHSIKYKYIKFPNRKTETGKIIDDFLKNMNLNLYKNKLRYLQKIEKNLII